MARKSFIALAAILLIIEAWPAFSGLSGGAGASGSWQGPDPTPALPVSARGAVYCDDLGVLHVENIDFHGVGVVFVRSSGGAVQIKDNYFDNSDKSGVALNIQNCGK